jgi:hypothetical protein
MDLMLKSKGKLEKAPKLNELISRFNNVSYWVATEICMCRDVKVRAEVLRRFLVIANKCFKYHNFNTCLQIVAALSMTCVQRLKQTWKVLPGRYHTLWRNLSTTFSASKNYLRYRKEVLSKLESLPTSNYRVTQVSFRRNGNANKVLGGIPFMGIHLSDMIYIEETAGKDILESGMINFSKMRQLADTFRRLTELQRITTYPYEVEPFTRRFLMYDTLILDEDKLWKASRICEPPEHQAPTIPIVRVNFTQAQSPRPSEQGSETKSRPATPTTAEQTKRVHFEEEDEADSSDEETVVDVDPGAASPMEPVIDPEDTQLAACNEDMRYPSEPPEAMPPPPELLDIILPPTPERPLPIPTRRSLGTQTDIKLLAALSPLRYPLPAVSSHRRRSPVSVIRQQLISSRHTQRSSQ